jgi:hypothetical protein
VLQEFTINGALELATGPATAEKARAKTQSSSPANRNASDFFGIIGLEHPGGCQKHGEDTNPAARRKNYFSKIACQFGATG